MDCFAGVAFGAAASSLLVSLTRHGSFSVYRPKLCKQIMPPSQSIAQSQTSANRCCEGTGPTQSKDEWSFIQHRLRQFHTRSHSIEDVETKWERGVSMEEAREMVDAAAAKSNERTSGEVLAALQRGNARFWTGHATRPEKNAFERRALIMKQFPSVAVLGCSDSRVPVEIVFDQGLGDMFVVRVAGNCLDTATSASLDYAVHHLKVKVVLVLGHEGCGAVKAAGLPMEQIDKESAALSKTLKNIKDGLDEQRLMHVRDAKAYDREAVVTNVKHQVRQLSSDQTFATKIREKEIILIGGFYEISSGIVDFFADASDLVHTNTGFNTEGNQKLEN